MKKSMLLVYIEMAILRTDRQTITYTHTNTLLVKEELANIHRDRQTPTHTHTHIQTLRLPRLIAGFSLY